MVADAMCLWTATALPTLGPAAIPAESTSGSPRGARCLDRPVPDHKGPCGCLLSHRCYRMLPLNRTGSPVRRSARATRCGRHLPSSEAQQHLRSLSHLSLTLRCTAPRSGWLGGCAPLQRPTWEPNGISIPVNDSERIQPSRCREERTRVRPPASATHRR